MYKKIIAAALSLLILCSLFTGCTNETIAEYEEDIKQLNLVKPDLSKYHQAIPDSEEFYFLPFEYSDLVKDVGMENDKMEEVKPDLKMPNIYKNIRKENVDGKETIRYDTIFTRDWKTLTDQLLKLDSMQGYKGLVIYSDKRSDWGKKDSKENYNKENFENVTIILSNPDLPSQCETIKIDLTTNFVECPNSINNVKALFYGFENNAETQKIISDIMSVVCGNEVGQYVAYANDVDDVKIPGIDDYYYTKEAPEKYQLDFEAYTGDIADVFYNKDANSTLILERNAFNHVTHIGIYSKSLKDEQLENIHDERKSYEYTSNKVSDSSYGYKLEEIGKYFPGLLKENADTYANVNKYKNLIEMRKLPFEIKISDYTELIKEVRIEDVNENKRTEKTTIESGHLYSEYKNLKEEDLTNKTYADKHIGATSSLMDSSQAMHLIVNYEEDIPVSFEIIFTCAFREKTKIDLNNFDDVTAKLDYIFEIMPNLNVDLSVKPEGTPAKYQGTINGDPVEFIINTTKDDEFGGVQILGDLTKYDYQEEIEEEN